MPRNSGKKTKTLTKTSSSSSTFTSSPLNRHTLASLNSDILNLFDRFNKSNKNNKSCNMDVLSIFNILKIMYNATDGKKREKLDETNLKNITQIIPKSQYYRTGIFISDKYKYNTSFKKQYKNEIFMTNIPKNKIEIENINKKIRKKFPKVIEVCENKDFINIENSEENDDEKDISEILENIFSNICLLIKDESYFVGEWKCQFYPSYTKKDIFYCGNGKTKYIEMMEGDSSIEEIYEYECKETDCQVISFKYTNNYRMIIIMPNIAHTKEQLMEFYRKNLNGEKINEYLLNLKSKFYHNKYMPKFEIKSTWQLNGGIYDLDDKSDKTPYISQLFDVKYIDFSNISKTMTSDNLVEYLSLQSISNIENTEVGTKTSTQTELLVYDSIIRNLKELKINKSFIYFIINENDIINNIGLFVG